MDKLLVVLLAAMFFLLVLPLTLMMGMVLWWTLADFAMNL